MLGKLKSQHSEQLSEKQSEIERVKQEIDKLVESKAQAEQNLQNTQTEYTKKQQDLESELNQHKDEIKKSSQELESHRKALD